MEGKILCNLIARMRVMKKWISMESPRRLLLWRNPIRMATGGRRPTMAVHANRLINEKSPYLLQHAHNPVDWFPWGPAAFEKAKNEGKPIFLSVGYSTCHWCHVMERESFQNEEIGRIMNQHFVCIKVDREERPDVDKVYMTFVQATSSGGGWPMSVWMTPDLRPFVGGTYFPPEDGPHSIGFRTVLLRIADQWENNKNSLLENSERIFAALQSSSALKVGERLPSHNDVLPKCFQQLEDMYDEEYGGFAQFPKFPTPVIIRFLFSLWALRRTSAEGIRAQQMALHTLKMMACGGIRDHIGQGFHRYSTDKSWHVPHFEKMLYDQAQLAVAYTEAFQITGDELFADVARDILNYVSRDMTDESGGFYSAEDADSYPTSQSTEKREGAFFVWTAAEIRDLLQDVVPEAQRKTMGDILMYYYGVKEEGNVSQAKDPHGELVGKNVLIQRYSLELTAARFHLDLGHLKTVLGNCRKKLFEVRMSRPKPDLDTKMVASWNGLMISGFARSGAILGNKDYVKKAENAATFLRQHMFDKDSGKLRRSCYRGEQSNVEQSSVPITGFLEDYAFVIQGLFDLYEASLDQRWLQWAVQLQKKQDELFWDPVSWGYFSSDPSDRSVILRLKNDQDGAEPSGNSIAASNLLRAASYTRHPDWATKAEKLFTAFSERLLKIPVSLPEMARALVACNQTLKQVVICGKYDAKDTQELLKTVYSTHTPHKVLIFVGGHETGFLHENLPFLASLERKDGKATAYICERFTCSLPVTSSKDLQKLLHS
ncbi:spermatogenesis-associated protein 20 isoform X2 [Pleurodeles waltl]|uniref:spermatogenesis-associated protein 20 isoform X2 n=1 Tax=Pleurodeles waltl TaxID=8319 RepID=UPI0037094E66